MLLLIKGIFTYNLIENNFCNNKEEKNRAFFLHFATLQWTVYRFYPSWGAKAGLYGERKACYPLRHGVPDKIRPFILYMVKDHAFVDIRI
jgi:hypothetical protein